MKKFFHYALRITNFALLLTLILVALSGTTFAKRAYRPLGVIIIDAKETKLGSYFNAVQSTLVPKSRARFYVGKDMQTQYQKYWYGFGKQYGHKFELDDIVEFTRVSGCLKVLFLINSDANPNADDKEKNSLTVNAYLCTNEGIKETFTATQEYDKLSERRGAFRKCFTKISKSLNPII